MPQFDPEGFLLAQVAWLILIFGLLFLVTWRMLPQVAGVKEHRASTIGGDLNAAEQARLDAEQKREAYEAGIARTRDEAQTLIGTAKADAARANEARMAKADAEAQARMKAAEAELDASREAALAKLDSIAAGATQDIVEKLTGRRPADNDAAAAVSAVRT